MDLLGVSESHIQGVGNMKLDGIDLFYSSRKNAVQRQGLRLMMNNEASKPALDW